MDELIDRLRYEVDISDRPGQMDRLNALADEFAAALEAAREERDALAKDAARYAIARRMSPQQWADAWELNHRTGKPFDEIIDDLAPFFDAAVAGRGKDERD